GNREWVTVIGAICADGSHLPPAVIYPAASEKVQANWVHDINPDTHDLRFSVSPSGWTNDDLGVAWLQQLLIINSYKSHYLVAFQDLCREKKIITLYMPLHLSHLLQPLNVACFLPLKRLYSDKVLALARSYIYYINKETFLLAFKLVFSKVFTRENIRAGFRGTRLVLHNLEVVLLKLNVRLRTLTPLKPSNVA
ncbi:CENP-B protein, partial [Didymella exigua CBS 183.55]